MFSNEREGQGVDNTDLACSTLAPSIHVIGYVFFSSMWTILDSAVNLKRHADFMLLAAICL